MEIYSESNKNANFFEASPPQSMNSELRKRRTAKEAGLSETVEPPKIDNGKAQISLISDEHKDKTPMRKYLGWERPVEKTNLTILLLFIFFSFATRFYGIGNGNFVVWDEAHFGKFASHYLNGTFYFDVHPPLGKMLVALAGKIAGYDGSFDFASGGDYGDKVNYMRMRMFVASFGAMVVPLSYIAAIQMRFRQPTAVMVGLMTLFGNNRICVILLENGFIGITRLILLDSMLIGFTAMTFASYAWFRNQSGEPFGYKWKLGLLFTGIGIGCVSSVKWVGFFLTALVGLMTIEELWNMLGDERICKRQFVRHFAARVLGLIFVPFAVYTLCFQIHFKLLYKSGPGDANMSSLFQAGLQGNDLASSPINLAYGSYVTLKSNTYGGGLLHSHAQVYPSGSLQQQVTTYHHKDSNNVWRVVYQHTEPAIDYDTLEIATVKDGDIIRLLHNATGHVLHSHPIAAPINNNDYEVSGYGRLDFDDPNDLWKVEIVADTRKGERILRSLTTRFRLKHVATGCYLKSRNNQLPEWGFKQGEVSCDHSPELGAKYLEWNVETHINEKLPAGNTSLYKSNFWDDFRDCNVGMYKTNNALVPDPELEPGILVSDAKDWFWMRKGIRMCNWADDRIKFYMLGNPIVWWTGSLAIIATIILNIIFMCVKQRKAYEYLPGDYENFIYRTKMITGGWAMTYLPFFIMGRVLYVHHYYPALIFSTLNVGFLFDMVVRGKSDRNQWRMALIFSAIVLSVFIYFSPMCYGIMGPGKAFRGRRWLKSWNL